MSRIKHPVRAIREPFGTAGLIVAIIALVLALTGAAFAAAGLSGKQKKEVEKIAKKFAGKPGTPGAQGPAGAAGKEGPEGPAGTNGKNGESVTNNAIAANPANAHCKEGGAEFKVGAGTPSYACNGSPWTAGGTLPKGSSESGVWTAPFPHNSILPFTLGSAPVSFGVPLHAAPALAFVNEAGEESTYNTTNNEFESFGTATHCLGSAATPKAKEGFACIYQEYSAGAAPLNADVNVSGVVVNMNGGLEGLSARGTWAVTSSE